MKTRKFEVTFPDKLNEEHISDLVKCQIIDLGPDILVRDVTNKKWNLSIGEEAEDKYMANNKSRFDKRDCVEWTATIDGFGNDDEYIDVEIDPITGFHILTTNAVRLINNDPYLSKKEKLDALADLKEKTGFEEHNGFYYIPTGVWDKAAENE